MKKIYKYLLCTICLFIIAMVTMSCSSDAGNSNRPTSLPSGTDNMSEKSIYINSLLNKSDKTFEDANEYLRSGDYEAYMLKLFTMATSDSGNTDILKRYLQYFVYIDPNPDAINPDNLDRRIVNGEAYTALRQAFDYNIGIDYDSITNKRNVYLNSKTNESFTFTCTISYNETKTYLVDHISIQDSSIKFFSDEYDKEDVYVTIMRTVNPTVLHSNSQGRITLPMSTLGDITVTATNEYGIQLVKKLELQNHTSRFSDLRRKNVSVSDNNLSSYLHRAGIEDNQFSFASYSQLIFSAQGITAIPSPSLDSCVTIVNPETGEPELVCILNIFSKKDVKQNASAAKITDISTISKYCSQLRSVVLLDEAIISADLADSISCPLLTDVFHAYEKPYTVDVLEINKRNSNDEKQ